MDTDVLVPPVEPVTTEPEPTSQPDSESIADHAEQFQPDDARTVTPELTEARRQNALTQKREEESGRFDRGRHRAASQKAGVEDVKVINDLTRELRTKEAELLKVRPDAGAKSPRVRALERQIKAIEAELGEVSKPEKSAPPVSRGNAPVSEVSAHNRPVSAPASVGAEPVLEDPKYQNVADPYQAWLKDWNRWDRKQEAYEQAQQARSEAAMRESQESIVQYQQRLATFAAQTPDFDVKTRELMQRTLPQPLLRAIAEDDKGPQFVYHLAQHPELLEDIVLKTYGRDARDRDFVASVQRFLTQHVAAVKTGSAPVPRTYTPPRPPNPVRTGSVQTSDDPPGEGSSIADHARYYGPNARR